MTGVKTVDGLLFDLDGTLVNTWTANFLAYRDAFAAHGHELTEAAFATTWGRDSRDFVPDLLPGTTPEVVTSIRVAKSEAYPTHLASTELNTALVAFLRMVAPTHRTALVTTAKSTNGRQLLLAHDLLELFDVIVYGDRVRRSKPDPEGYLLALAELDLPAARCLAFEDSATGKAAAAAAGLAVLEVPAF